MCDSNGEEGVPQMPLGDIENSVNEVNSSDNR